jgi:diguanylate cyclase (GGDEF)-like protein
VGLFKILLSLMQEVTLLAMVLLLSVVLQSAAALIALHQVGKVDGRYRMAWLIVALALVLMVERRLVPLWRHVSAGELSSMLDAGFGLAISTFMVAGVYGLTELLTGLKSRAEIDSLTGLANRSAVLESVQNEIERAMRTHRPLSFLMYDLDHFKAVNDRYGHPSGDLVLQGIADIAMSTFRKIDTVGRLGGEEFLVVLPESDQAAARIAAERFRSAVAEHKFVAGEQRIEITISIGVFAPETVTSFVTVQTVMQVTDKALYEAKNAGRNCVMVRGLTDLQD